MPVKVLLLQSKKRKRDASVSRVLRLDGGSLDGGSLNNKRLTPDYLTARA
jgi:hypothetical protein